MTYERGQIYPPSGARGYFGPQCQPVWNCINVYSAAKAHLACRQFIRDANMFAFFPSCEKMSKRFNRTTYAEVPLDGMTGYVFAQFLRAPQWDLWPNQPWFLDVFRIGENPYAFRYIQIRHLQGLTVDAERLAAANAAMQDELAAAERPIPQAMAAIISGLLAGSTVMVEDVRGDTAHFEHMGKKLSAPAASMRRLA